MELPVQDSCLALRAPALYIVRACLYIYGMFTSDKATGQSWEQWRENIHSLCSTVPGA